MDRRERPWRQLTKAMPPIAELATEELDGETFAIRNEARCRVCSLKEKDLPDAHRVVCMIDRLLVTGSGYKAVLRHLHPFMETWPAKHRPGYASLRNHARRHLLIDETLIREIVERHAAAQGKKILDGVEPLLTRAAVLEAVVQMGLTNLAAGTTIPNVRDMLAASEALEEISESSAQLQLKRLQDEFDVIVQAIREVVPSDLWPQIISRIDSLRASTEGEGRRKRAKALTIEEDNNGEEK